MRYKKLLVTVDDEYQGESFGRDVYRRDGEIFVVTAEANYELVDRTGTVIDSGSCTRSVDDLYFSFHIADTVTADLSGPHSVFVHITDTVNTTFDDIIAEYRITYNEKRAI